MATDCRTRPCLRMKASASRTVIGGHGGLQRRRLSSETFAPSVHLTGVTAINDAVRVRPIRLQTVAAFLAIYLIWGSTFLAIRYAIESIPPLLTAGTRHLLAGAILAGWALWKGERPTRQ